MILSDSELERELAGHEGWHRAGEALVRELRFRDFDAALAFVEAIARAAVDYERRPDMCISEFNHVRLTVSNSHHAGFTEAELRLLAKVDEILKEKPGAQASAGGK